MTVSEYGAVGVLAAILGLGGLDVWTLCHWRQEFGGSDAAAFLVALLIVWLLILVAMLLSLVGPVWEAWQDDGTGGGEPESKELLG